MESVKTFVRLKPSEGKLDGSEMILNRVDETKILNKDTGECFAFGRREITQNMSLAQNKQTKQYLRRLSKRIGVVLPKE